MSKNKRKSERSPIELAASYGIPQDLPDTEEAQVKDVSAGGFCIYSPKKIPEGKAFILAVDLDNNEQITVTVKAVWCQPEEERFRVGVQIMEENSPDLKRFLEFYNSLSE